MATEEIDVRVRLKDDLSKPLHRTEEQVKATTEETDNLGDSTDKLTDKQRRAAVAAQRLENAEKRVQMQSAKLVGESERLARQTERVAKSQAKAAAEEAKRVKEMRYAGTIIGKLDNRTKSLRLGLSKYGREIKSVVGRLFALNRVFGLLKVGAFVTAINLAAAAIGGLTAAAAGALGALGPVTGILGGIPAMAVGASLAIGVMKTAFSGIGEAIKALSDPSSTIKDINKATRGLTPAAKAFAVQVANIKDAWVPVRDAVQQATLPLVGQAMQRVVYTYLPMMQSELSKLGHLFGELANQASKSLATVAWQKDLGFLFQQNRVLTEKWAHVFGNLAGVIKDIAVSAAPMMQMFADWALQVSQRMEDWFASARKSGRLTAFFDSTFRTVKAIAGWAWDLSMAFFNIFSIGAGMGRTLGGSLAKVTEQFRAWTESEGGRKKISGWFKRMLPVARQLGKLAVAIVKAFFGLTTMPGAAKLIKQIRKELLPVVVKLFRTVGTKLGPGLITLVSSLGTLATTVASGGLLENLNNMVKVLNDIVGWLNSAPQSVQNVLGLVAAFALLGKVSGLTQMVGLFGKLVGWFAKTQRGAALLTRAGGLLSIAIRGIGSAMLFLVTNPIGLVILAIAAVVIAIILLWKKNEAFRNFIKKTWAAITGFFSDSWHWLKDNWPAILDVLTAPFTLAKKFISDKWNDLMDLLKAAPGAIARLGKSMWDGIKDGFVGMLNGIIGLWNNFHLSVDIPDWVPGLPNDFTLKTPDMPLMRWAGGPVWPGQDFVVGEIGPELLKTASGLQWLGLNGPELFRPSVSGTVIPNHEVAQHVPSVPAESPRERDRSSSGSSQPIPPININLLGDANGLTPEDIEAAAMRAYRRFERERKDRT